MFELDEVSKLQIENSEHFCKFMKNLIGDYPLECLVTKVEHLHLFSTSNTLLTEKEYWNTWFKWALHNNYLLYWKTEFDVVYFYAEQMKLHSELGKIEVSLLLNRMKEKATINMPLLIEGIDDLLNVLINKGIKTQEDITVSNMIALFGLGLLENKGERSLFKQVLQHNQQYVFKLKIENK